MLYKVIPWDTGGTGLLLFDDENPIKSNPPAAGGFENGTWYEGFWNTGWGACWGYPRRSKTLAELWDRAEVSPVILIKSNGSLF